MPLGSMIGSALRKFFKDSVPKIEGDTLMLEVELRCPRGWKLDNLAKSENGNFCWLQHKAADAPVTENPTVRGDLTLPSTPAEPAVVACAVALEEASKDRYLRILVGHRTDVTVHIPLPANPGSESKAWTPWTSQSFLPQQSKPVPPGYAIRYRVQGTQEYAAAHPSPAIAIQAARAQAVAAMPADASLQQWLPFFEDERGQPDVAGVGFARALDVLKTHPAQLGPLLRSKDKNVVRRAVFGVAALEATPSILIDALAAAGRRTIDFMKEARAGALPNDPDLVAAARAFLYFSTWDKAMEQAGPAGAAKRRAVLEEIERDARSPASDGDIHRIAEQSRKVLDSLT
jgi:hypothetical protein